MGKYCDYYCDNNNQKLKPIVDNIIRRNFGWLSESEYDEFYSIAGETVWYCELRYDVSRNDSFERYLINSLQRKIKSRITYINRKKRKGDADDISLDAYIAEEENMTVSDFIASKEVPDIDPLTQRYLDSLSNKQKRVAEMIMDGYDNAAIKKILGLSDKQFNMTYKRMKSNEKTEILRNLKEKQYEGQ